MNVPSDRSLEEASAPSGVSLGRAGWGLLLAGALLSGVALSQTQLFRDEANTFATAQAPSVRAMLDDLIRDGNTPLYPLLLRALFRVFGSRDVVAQSFSVGCFLAACGVLFRWTARTAGRTAGLCALASAVLGGIWLDVALQVRPYALVVLCATLALQAWISLGEGRGRPLRHAGVLGLAMTGALYTHPWAVFAFGSMGAISGFALVFGERESRVRWGWVCGTLLAAGAAWSPLLLLQLKQAGQNLAPWSGPASWESLLLLVQNNLLSLQLLAVMVLVDAVLFWTRAPRLLPGTQEMRRRARPVVLVLLWLLGFLALAVAASFVTTCWAGRYAVIATPGAFFILGIWAGRMWEGRGRCRRRMARGLLVFGFVGALRWTLVGMGDGYFQKTNAREMADAIKVCWQPGDLVVVSSFAYAPSIAHYLPPEYPIMAYPYGDRGVITRWAGIAAKILDDSSVAAFTSSVDARLRPSSRLWLVDPFKATAMGYGVASGWIQRPVGRRRFNYAEVLRTVEIERWCSANGKKVAAFRPMEETRVREGFYVSLFVMKTGEKPPAVVSDGGKEGLLR
ncbi:MAG: glycosyltransferase family 39 protein [Verrucomicrobiae bacterium]|nr:glycosyltransferase family 39 protein [Verrucomicrobiae bacterium]